jgi:hypothetical protein
MHVYILLRRIFNLGTKRSYVQYFFPFSLFVCFLKKLQHITIILSKMKVRESLIRRERELVFMLPINMNN